MKQAVLLMGHGSRDPKGNSEFIEMGEYIKQQLDGIEVYPSFLEFAHPTIQETFDTIAQEGVGRIICVPYLLLRGAHTTKDMPGEIAKASARYPTIEFVYTEHFGFHPSMFALLMARFYRARTRLNDEERRKQTAALLVGRGSLVPQSNEDMAEVTREFQRRSGIKVVEHSFISLAKPRIPEGVVRCVDQGAESIIALPYFLFTGVLLKRIARQLAEQRRQYPHVKIIMGTYLGIDAMVAQVICDRVGAQLSALSRQEEQETAS